MKCSISLIAILFISLQALAGGQKFQEAMAKTLGGYADCRSSGDFTALAAKFSRIAQAEPEEWLPLYYQAHAIIVGNFRSKESAIDRDLQLDEAQKAIDKMLALVTDESEVMVLQGMLYTGRLILDPQTRGQEYGAKSAIAIGKAQGMNPSNPRARYMQIANDQGTAQFFGKDLESFCDQAQTLLDAWDEMDKPSSPLHPSWGKEMTTGIARSCD